MKKLKPISDDDILREDGALRECKFVNTGAKPVCRPRVLGSNTVGQATCMTCGATVYGDDAFNFYLIQMHKLTS